MVNETQIFEKLATLRNNYNFKTYKYLSVAVDKIIK